MEDGIAVEVTKCELAILIDENISQANRAAVNYKFEESRRLLGRAEFLLALLTGDTQTEEE